MNYDLYVTRPSGNVVTMLRLLAGTEDSASAAKKFAELVHGVRQKDGILPPSEYDKFIAEKMSTLQALGLISSAPDFSLLPPAPGSSNSPSPWQNHG